MGLSFNGMDATIEKFVVIKLLLKQVIPYDSLKMHDAKSFKKMLKEHIETFKTPVDSITTDKGYYSKDNERIALGFGIKMVGIQRTNRKLTNGPDNPISEEEQELLYKRRSGIEPLIGHLKNHYQIGQSRAKTDRTTESSGYASILGFNLKQMIRYLSGHAVPVASTEQGNFIHKNLLL